MNPVSLAELRRMAEALDLLRGRSIADAVIRSDLRQLRIDLSDGQVMVVSMEIDDTGRPRLEVDVVRQPEETGRQLEVRFDTV